MQSSYLRWNYNNPELAVAGTILHGFEFVFVDNGDFDIKKVQKSYNVTNPEIL